MRKTFYAKIVAIIAMVVIMLSGSSALAYTGDGYSIDIPSTYTSGGSNQWINSSSKATVNVQIVDNSSGQVVSESTLQESIDGLKSAYAGIIIDKSEVTKLNGMDAIHIVSYASSMYIEQYAVATSTKIYVLTMGAMEKSYLSGSEASAIYASFKVPGAKSTGTGYTNNGGNTTTNNTTNTDNNTTNNTVNNTTNNTTNTSNDDNKITNTDDDDDEENKTSKKKSSKSDDDEEESKTWIIVAVIAGAAVLILIVILIIVAIVVSGKNKQQY